MKKIFLTMAVAAAAVMGASSAHAGVRVTLGFPGPVVVARAPVYYPAPRVVYAPPAPVVVAPAPVYCAPPVVYAPAPVVVAPAPVVRFGFGFGHPFHHYRRW